MDEGIPARLRAFRIHHQLSQSEMARILGISQGWVSKLEAGNGDLTVKHLLALKERFNLDVDAFLDPKTSIEELQKF